MSTDNPNAMHVLAKAEESGAAAPGAMLATAPPPPRTGRQVNLVNDGPFPRRQWVDVGLDPSAAHELTGEGKSGLRLVLPDGTVATGVRGESSEDVQFYAFWLTVPVGRTTAVLEAGELWQSKFVLHEQLAGNVLQLAVQIEIVCSTGVHRAQLEAKSLYETPAKHVFRVVGRVPNTPIRFEGFSTVYHQQQHVRLNLRWGMTCQDDQWNGQQFFDVTSITMRCGAYPYVEHGNRRGIGTPGQDQEGLYRIVLSGSRRYGRAELSGFRGWLIPRPDTGNEAATDNAAGILGGGIVYATWCGWRGRYSTNEAIPDMPEGWGDGWAEADRRAFAHRAAMQAKGDMYDQRPRGLYKEAGSTGAQDDFGAAQDVIALTVADPRAIDELWFSTDGYWLRPFHNRDAQGLPVSAANHPNALSWSQVPELRVGSRDQMGWPDRPDRPASGWSGIDDQHRSQEMITALMHLDPCPSLLDLCLDFVAMDRMRAKAAQQSLDAPRAEGRLAAAWADMLGLHRGQFADPSVLLETIDRWGDLLAEKWHGKNFGDGQVRCVALGTSPEIQQHQVPAVVWWEHSIFVMGLWGLAVRGALPSALHPILKTIAGEVVRHAFWRTTAGGWAIALATEWLGGQPLQAEDYAWGSPRIAAGGGDWWAWMLPTVRIAAELGVEQSRCRELLAAWGGAPRTEQFAEWGAVIPQPESLL